VRTRFGVSRYAIGEEEPLSLLPVPEEQGERFNTAPHPSAGLRKTIFHISERTYLL
jgi:hypothetical protein